ncbi:hypothetical protein TSAR_007215 [Trichomalopsis sarcophagae]|uniref:Uncharacterized protein n=1 Tax=Trichomalopsis sarcophagae TaxID=543379 RepID=A0A232FM22_9HYME|nr:hypothetical protein TSAR_007215 [Trichomalopsis sarcophagae]
MLDEFFSYRYNKILSVVELESLKSQTTCAVVRRREKEENEKIESALKTRFSDYFNIVGDVAPCLNCVAQNAVQILTHNLIPQQENDTPAVEEDKEMISMILEHALQTSCGINHSFYSKQEKMIK